MSINCLPDSIILQVFSYLRKRVLCQGARLTCKRWWLISQDPSLWKELVIPVHFTDHRFLLLMQQVGPHVEELDCSLCEVLTCNVFLQLTTICPELPNIKKLALPIEPNTTNTVDNVGDYFKCLSMILPNLESLENISCLNTDLTVNTLECQSYFSNITYLYDNPTTSFGRISEVLRHKNKEKAEKWSINIQQVAEICSKVCNYKCTKGSGYIGEMALELIGSLFPNLSTIELRFCTLTDQAVEKFFAHCNFDTVREIVLEKPDQLSDIGLATIAKYSKNLKKIKLSRCSEITRTGILFLASNCVSITSLHINTSKGWSTDTNSNVLSDQIDDDTVDHIAKNCIHLESLRILYSSKLTKHGIHSLYSHSKHLRALMFFECPKIGDSALKDIAKIQPLQRLVLVSTQVSPKGVINLILEAPSLKALTLYCNDDSAFDKDMSDLGEEIYSKIDAPGSDYRPNSVTSIALRGVGGAFVQLITVLSPNLLHLDLRDGKSSFSTSTLKSALSNCDYLETLDVSAKLALKTVLFEAMAETGKCLRKLSLSSNVKLCKTEHFLPIIQRCRCLEMIAMDISGSDIDEKQLAMFIKEYHGDQCYTHVDPSHDRDPQFNSKFISFHFTPIIYLT